MKNFLLRNSMELLIIAMIGFAALAISSAYEEAERYTKVCNESGGVALQSDSPSRRQCVKDMGKAVVVPR